MSDGAYSWNTTAELAFVAKLGQGRPAMERLALLERYYAACEARTTWGDVDRDAVLAAIDAECNRIEAARPRRRGGRDALRAGA